MAGVDLDSEMHRLARLAALGGVRGPLSVRPAELSVRRATLRPRSRLGFAVPAQWRISVTAYPDIRGGDALETLLHEMVHLVVGRGEGYRRWHGSEFTEALHAAMLEGWGLGMRPPPHSRHGLYADAIERTLRVSEPGEQPVVRRV